jgi:hypothetical protein
MFNPDYSFVYAFILYLILQEWIINQEKMQIVYEN